RYAILPRRRLLDERADPTDDLAGSIAALDDTSERLLGLREIGGLDGQPAQSSLGVCNYRCDGLVHFMSDRSRELAHGCDAIGVCQLRLCPAQGFGSQHVVGEVARDSKGGLHPFKVRPQRRVGHRQITSAKRVDEPLRVADFLSLKTSV